MDILASRRSFLAGAAAFSLSGCVGSGAGFLGGSRPRLKFGAISDIHITDWASTEIFRKALRYYRDAGVDAVLIAGDLADHGILPQLENVAKAWFEVFPEDRAPDGRKVDRIFVYGNHDPEGLDYRDGFMDAQFKAMGLTYEAAREFEIRKIGMDKSWEKCFHEAYEPIGTKSVKGYDFVLAHWDSWSGVRGLEDWFKANVSKIDTTKPFFFTQHPHPKDTCFGPWAWGHDAGQSTRALSPYPNAVAFTGHSHYSLGDERDVWRGEFTSIGTSSLSYTCLPGFRANERVIHDEIRRNLSVRQGMLVTVTDDELFIERRDFCRDETIDTAWRLEMPAKPSPFKVRAAKAPVPAFAAGAEISVEFPVPPPPPAPAPAADGAAAPAPAPAAPAKPLEVVVKFPPATANAEARPYDYDLVLESRGYDVAVVEKTWRLYNPTAALPRSADAKSGPVEFVFARSLVPKRGEFRLTVVPRNCYGVAGEGVSTPWSVQPPVPKPQPARS